MIGYVGRGHSDWIGAVWKELVLFAGDGFGHGAPSEPLESDWRLRMAMVSYKDQSSRLTPLTLVKMSYFFFALAFLLFSMLMAIEELTCTMICKNIITEKTPVRPLTAVTTSKDIDQPTFPDSRPINFYKQATN